MLPSPTPRQATKMVVIMVAIMAAIMMAIMAFLLAPLISHPKRQNLGRRAIFLKREAPGISVKSPLQKTSQLRQLGRSQTPRTHVRTRLLQALALPLLQSPALAVQAKALLSTSCPSPPTLSKCLFFQKHELSKTVSLPELESEIITPRNTRFLGKPSEPPACLWTRQSGVC